MPACCDYLTKSCRVIHAGVVAGKLKAPLYAEGAKFCDCFSFSIADEHMHWQILVTLLILSAGLCLAEDEDQYDMAIDCMTAELMDEVMTSACSTTLSITIP